MRIEINFIMALMTLITGIMIAKEDLKELFEPLFREE
jgi:hypothetical protein